MEKYIIGCDAHKLYSGFSVHNNKGTLKAQKRVKHEPGAIRELLEAYPPGTRVALESVGYWYWIADKIETAGCIPQLTHTHECCGFVSGQLGRNPAGSVTGYGGRTDRRGAVCVYYIVGREKSMGKGHREMDGIIAQRPAARCSPLDNKTNGRSE